MGLHLSGSTTASLSVAYVARKHHNTVTPYSPPGQYSSGRTTCGVDATLGKVWCYNSSGLQQVDALTSTAWSVLTMPTNVSAASQAAKVVTVGTTMFMCSWNTVTTRYEVYSATVGLKSATPTWSSVLLQMAANATLIPTAMRATFAGSVLVGEYTGTPDITGGPSIYRSTGGGAFTRVLQLATARHIHGIYEDPLNHGTLYATVGDYFGSYAPVSAIYKSTDDGATWAAVTSVNNAAGNWQAVALGFTSDYIWAVSDQSTGGGPYIMDRATMTPRWASIHGRVDRIPVPGGQGGRWLTDVGLTNASTTLTSASGAFTALDVGRRVMGHNGIPLGTYISAFTNSTTVTLSGGSSTTGTNQTVLIGGDSFYANGYAGAVDPASGYLYYVANDASNAGNTAGLFVLTGPGDRPALVWALPNTPIGNHEVYIAGGYLWVDRVGPMPLLTAV